MNLPAIIPPPRLPVVLDQPACADPSAALDAYDRQLMPAQRPSVLQIAFTALLSRRDRSKPKHPIKLSTRFHDLGDGTHKICAVFENKSKFEYPGGRFMFRVKEGRKVVVQSCHEGGYQIGYFSEAYTEASYTKFGLLRPGEYEEIMLPGFYTSARAQDVEITLLPY